MSSVAVDKHPPAWLLRIVNPVLRTLLRSPAGRALPRLAVLEFTGRRTDRTYRVVTGWYAVDGRELAVTPAAWRANLTGGRPLQVTNRGRARRGTGRLDDDPVEVAAAVRALLATGTTTKGLGMSMPRDHAFDEADVASTGKALVRFTPA